MWRQTELRRRWSLAAAVLPVCVMAASVVCAADPAGEELFRAQLAAGEFAPALAAARQAPTPAQRDAWLAEVAQAQAHSGMRDAALNSAADIGNDLSRAQSVAQLAREPLGGLGGGGEADFESLIDLITSTVRPASWDGVGGPGSIAGFPTGVSVDAQGLVRKMLREESGDALAKLRAAGTEHATRGDVRRDSPLRMVSLPRLEKQVQLRQARGQLPTEAMQVLAGLQRIEYLFVYPESGDLVVAGPAGDWTPTAENRIVSVQGGWPVMRLDDLVVVMRHVFSGPDARFGCMITPTQEGLARVQAFVKESGKSAIQAEQRPAWLTRLRRELGTQDIEVYGLDPHTHAARIMVEADYRMKLVGIGLEAGVPGVQSYLASVTVPAGQAPPPMGVLRWWFTLNYDALAASNDHLAFALRGQGVKVQSENERLTAEGKRIHTGQAEDLNRKFAQSFTQHFTALAAKYPVYAELQNLFDLAVIGTLLREEDLPARLGWHMTCFGDPAAFQVELGAAPKKVESVVNCRVVNRIHILAGVSGGVAVNPSPLVERSAMQLDRQGGLAVQRASVLQTLPHDAWWWDP